MDSNVYNGVRAEPKFLRDPTSLESISSGISRLSSYVTSNLAKRKSISTSPFDYYQQQQQMLSNQLQQQKEEEETIVEDGMEDVDTVTFSAFDKIDNKSCLLLGYHDGFQIWDITSPDNVHELCSIRDKELFGTVSFIHIIQHGSLLAISMLKDCSKETNNTEHQRINSMSSTNNKKQCKVMIYSVASQSIIKEINDFHHDEEDDTTQVTCIKSNDKVTALGCVNRTKSSIHLLSVETFEAAASPIIDVYHDIHQGPVFTLGSRLIGYATNAAVLNSDPIMTSLTNKSLSHTGFGVLQGEKDVKGAAKDIAKEVVSGMKSLSEFGYKSLSNYFGKEEYHMTPPMEADSVITTNVKKMIPSGMIMIRDIVKLPKTATRNISSSMIAHFRPHTHPISCLQFNPAGTLLMSASKQGHTFHIFSILLYGNGNATHLYSLSRGITDAQVENCEFSLDSTWCAITTARGTTHLYAINPYGGKPEISGHVYGKVNNPMVSIHHQKTHIKPYISKATTLNSVVRIKQRRKMPDSMTLQEDLKANIQQQQFYIPPTQIMMPPPPLPQLNRSNSTTSVKDPRAKITCMFITNTKTPYLFSNNAVMNTNATNSNTNNTSVSSTESTSISSSPVVGTIKQQATNMLSSFGSSMSHIPYLPQQPKMNKWEKDKSELMFGFDEEYDDSTKMINDEIGYQDLYSFHPGGILTLHRCWIAKTVVKKRENGRTLEKLDLSLRQEDVAEWRVARSVDWEQVKWVIDDKKQNVKPTKKKVDGNTKKLWLSNAEITTYASIPEDPALWTHHQFSFQTFKETKDMSRLLKSGIVPPTDTVIMLKGMPEPVSSRIDRVRKTTTHIANDNVEENMEDALAELEDNLSKAMQTSFSPSSNSMNNSPAAASLKWLSSSANNTPSSFSKSFLDKNSSVSFEDAYLIHLGSGPSPELPLQRSSLIQFDDSDEEQPAEEDIIKLEESDNNDVYSPDGDNEVAYPSESVFGDLNHRVDEQEEEW